MNPPADRSPVTAASAVPAAPARGDAGGELIDGRYRLVDVVGRGGLAVVWRAVDERLRRTVAVKLFRHDATDPAREHAELEVMARLSHPNLVMMYDGGVHRGPNGSAQTYLVMELVDGPTLHQILAAGPAGTEIAAQTGLAIAHGLTHIHARGVIHRDIKPANILLPRADGVILAANAKLADFGIARASGSGHLTEIGLVVGTAGYVSPEQVRGEELGPRSDVYSLALVLIEMLTGRPEYPGADVIAAGARLYRRPSIPTVGFEWTELLRSMCHDEPARRPSSVEVVRALSRLAADTRTDSATIAMTAGPAVGDTVLLDPGPRHGRAARPRRRKLLPWFIAAALGLGVLVTAGLRLTAADSRGPSPSVPPRVLNTRVLNTPGPTASRSGQVLDRPVNSSSAVASRTSIRATTPPSHVGPQPPAPPVKAKHTSKHGKKK